MALPPFIEGVRRRPGMYVSPETFDCVVSFLCGYDAAQSGGFLVGFREWLVVRADGANNLAWPGLVRLLPEDVQAEADSAKSISGLFALLEEYFDARQAHDGLRKIYVQYQDWLRRQQWHIPD